MGGLSTNQKKIMEILQIKPDMTTKEIAELTLSRIVSYKSKEFTSVHRSLISLERQGRIQRVHVQLRWRLATEKKNEETPLKA
jgi:hypothetical protein